MKKILLFTAVTLFFVLSMHGINVVCNQDIANAEDGWEQEYAAICAETHNAMTLSVTELKDYIQRCDTLQERLHELNGQTGNTKRKVYEKRLKMCRDLYDFALKYKEEKSNP